MILNLISGPRNVSTALMYSFAQRSDTTVMDEPFYGVYLSVTKLPHPGAEDVLRTMPLTESKVRDAIKGAAGSAPVVFVKNMAHHMEVLRDPFIADAVNIFLIRDPEQILASYTRVIEKPVMRDIGIAFQHQLFTQLCMNGIEPIVIDSMTLLKNPDAVLSKLCGRCGLKYETGMTRWPAGPKKYDGVWAPHWYRRVHMSEGFETPGTHTGPLPDHLRELYLEADRLYKKLLPFSIKP